MTMSAAGALRPLLLASAPLSIFSNASDAAGRVTRLAWFMIILSAVIFAGVMATMIAAMMRNRSRDAAAVDLSERGTGWIIWGGTVMPAIVLVALFVVGMTAMGRYPLPAPALTIHVTGHQWWWQLDYELPSGRGRFRSANEIHIPVGKSVRILLTSSDVIHSFWVPRLQGKLDVIPGDTNDLRLVAAEPGTYYGACAEYCGVQHTHMGFTVIADDSAAFAKWAGEQLAAAAPPRDSLALQGEQLFAGGVCAGCHTVRGTPAAGQDAPDLTHVASRRTIAAGVLPNTPGSLEGWIANAQALKPGAKMPTITQFNGRQLRALASYVASLK